MLLGVLHLIQDGEDAEYIGARLVIVFIVAATGSSR